MVSLLASGAVNHVFKPGLDQTKNYEIGIWFFSFASEGVRAKTGWL